MANLTIRNLGRGGRYLVSYYVNGALYTEWFSADSEVLQPSVVIPSLSGATFLGWSKNVNDPTPLNSQKAERGLVLFAIFKYDDVSIPFIDTEWNNYTMLDNISGDICTTINISWHVATWSGGDHARFFLRDKTTALETWSSSTATSNRVIESTSSITLVKGHTYAFISDVNDGGDGGARARIKFGTRVGRTVVG